MEPNLFIEQNKAYPCEVQDVFVDYSLESSEPVKIV